jgi:hypothetical protein
MPIRGWMTATCAAAISDGTTFSLLEKQFSRSN